MDIMECLQPNDGTKTDMHNHFLWKGKNRGLLVIKEILRKGKFEYEFCRRQRLKDYIKEFF